MGERETQRREREREREIEREMEEKHMKSEEINSHRQERFYVMFSITHTLINCTKTQRKTNGPFKTRQVIDFKQ